MQTILRIIERAEGWNPGLFLKIENAPYMALVSEAIEEGPSGLPNVSINPLETALSSAKPESRRPTTNNSTKLRQTIPTLQPSFRNLRRTCMRVCHSSVERLSR
jgi:hypothetical protein